MHEIQPHIPDLLADGLVRVAEAAKFLGCSRRLVHSLIQSGELPSVVVGQTRRIPRRGLTEYALRTLTGRSEPLPERGTGE